MTKGELERSSVLDDLLDKKALRKNSLLGLDTAEWA